MFDIQPPRESQAAGEPVCELKQTLSDHIMSVYPTYQTGTKTDAVLDIDNSYYTRT